MAADEVCGLRRPHAAVHHQARPEHDRRAVTADTDLQRAERRRRATRLQGRESRVVGHGVAGGRLRCITDAARLITAFAYIEKGGKRRKRTRRREGTSWGERTGEGWGRRVG